MCLLIMNWFNVMISIPDLRVFRIITTFGLINVIAREPSWKFDHRYSLL